MKIVNLLLSAVMASMMVFQGAAFDAQAAEGVSAEVVTMAQSSATVI